MTYAELVRLKMTPHQVNNFNPMHGVDITWLDYDYDNSEVTARMVASEFNPDYIDMVYKENFEKYINTLPVVRDGIRWSKHSTKILRKTEGFIGDSILDGQFDHKRSNATDAHYIELTKEKMNELNNDMIKAGKKPLKPDKVIERNGKTKYFFLFGSLE